VRGFPANDRAEADDGIEGPRSGKEVCGLREFERTRAMDNPDVTPPDPPEAQALFRASP